MTGLASSGPEGDRPYAEAHTPVVWLAATTPAGTAELEAAGQPPHLARLLARRGVRNAADAERFLRPSPHDLHDPLLLGGMEQAVARLVTARKRRQRIVIVGDYDVDGVSATALLLAVFRACGMDARPVLPHRLRDGYGFQELQVATARELGASLIVTVDCGTGSAPAIRAALASGIDVIVTDHHLPGADFPQEAIQINPRQLECGYPFADLCGAGLALKLAQAVADAVGRRLELAPLLRIACLGTIADLVPLVGENRAIAALGLHALGRTRSPGLLALFEEAGLTPPLRAADVGFRIGPRLNAVGRLASPDAALELLLSREPERAAELAASLGTWNSRRRDEERRVVAEAHELLAARQPRPGILVAWSEEWHRGVVGIAAGRIAAELHRPTILFAVEGESATGSGRSIRDVALHAFLDRWRSELVRFGGHDFAVGLTARTADLDRLRQLWENEARWPENVLVRTYEYELEPQPADVGRGLIGELLRLEPHGPGNPQPLVRVSSLRVEAAPRLFGGENEHLKVRARGTDGSSVWLLGWRWASRWPELDGRTVDVLGHLEWDAFLATPVLRLVDCRPAAAVDEIAAAAPPTAGG
jgi:single-stranded-DNA-specific exonuclease